MLKTSMAKDTRHWRITLIIVVLLGVAALIWFLNSPLVPQSKNKHSGAAGAVPVGIATAQKGDIDIIKQALGTVTPLTNVIVQTQISGVITQVAFQEGQIVNKGDLLIEIDPRPYELSLQQNEGALARDQALLKDAQLNLTRYQKLLTEDSISKQQVTTQEALVAQYQGDIETDQAQIDIAKLNLVYCHITAPVTGRVGLRQVDQGNYVQVGGNATNGLVTLTQLQPITVIFTLPEDDLPAIMKRLSQGAELSTTAFDRTQTTKLGEGKLVAVDNQIDTATGTVKFRAQFDNVDNMLFPNQFVNIQLLVDTLHDTTIIPQAAIQRGAPGTYVYLVNDNNTVSVKKVTLGPSQGDNVAITDGLQLNDKVVVDGADKLREGAEIKIPGEKKNASPSTPPTPQP